MNQSTKSPGLLLQSIPYLGQKKILKILTHDHGLITLFAKTTTLTPFSLAEWVFRKSHRELYSLQDATLLDPLLSLKESYLILTAAGSIAQDLLRTQLPNKKGPLSLAYAYLQKLPLNPPILAASFRLKLLLHEGLLSADPDPAFTPQEWEQVYPIAFCTHFSQIIAQSTAPFTKIEQLFTQRMNL